MISTQYRVRLDLKYETPGDKAECRLEKCHAALYPVNALSVESFDGMAAVGAAPYIEVVVEDIKQAERIESQLKKIIGRWLDA